MAKAKKTNGRRARARRPRGARVARGLTPYQKILIDPCHAELTRPYSGEMGIVQRFVYDGTINVDNPDRTCGFLLFQPQRPSSAQFSWGTSSAATAIAYGGNAPGYTFLLANAAKLRCHAACAQLFAAGASFSNLTGEWAVGVLSGDTLQQGSSISVDGLFQLSNQRGTLTKEGVEVKWQPGTLDHTYNSVNEGMQADNNLVFVAYRGFPAGVPMSYRYTSVLEWTPKVGVGIPSTAAISPGVAHTEQVAALSTYSPGWWTAPAHAIMQDVGQAARYVARQGLTAAARVATSRLNATFGALLV